MTIVGRSAELAELTAAWDRASEGVPELAVVWGRRRVGKTYLLTHFARDKRAVYFTATRQDSDDRQLRRFAAALREQLGEKIADLVPAGFPNWEAALRFVAQLARADPLLVVLDEAPRLTGGHADFADTVSAVWENHIRDQRLMLVLSGSAERSTEQNLDELAFTPGGLLLRDAPDILSEDLDWRGGYERVLTAMAGGARRRSRIASRAQQRIDYTLDRLRRAGYVRVVRPIGAGGSPDPLHEIADDYLAYWFSVLRDDADLIDGGQGSAVRRRTWGRWQTHVARVFVSAARHHAQRLVAAGDLPAEMVIGRWWKDETVEIDVLGLVGDAPGLVGECRWQTKPLTLRDLTDLQRRAAHLPPAGKTAPAYAFWSRGGGDETLTRHPEVRTFTPADLLRPASGG